MLHKISNVLHDNYSLHCQLKLTTEFQRHPGDYGRGPFPEEHALGHEFSISRTPDASVAIYKSGWCTGICAGSAPRSAEPAFAEGSQHRWEERDRDLELGNLSYRWMYSASKVCDRGCLRKFVCRGVACSVEGFYVLLSLAFEVPRKFLGIRISFLQVHYLLHKSYSKLLIQIVDILNKIIIGT